MSKEYEKFKTESQALGTKYGSITTASYDAYRLHCKAAGPPVFEGVDHLRSMITRARRSGINGDKPADFSGDTDTKEAIKLLKIAVGRVQDLIAEGTAMAKSAAEGFPLYDKLSTAIGNDLKKRKDSSESKNLIIALETDADNRVKELKSVAAKAARSYFTPDYIKIADKLDAAIVGIFHEKADDVAADVDQSELPQKFQDRVLNKSLKQSTVKAKQVMDLCSGTADKVLNGDRAGAIADLKLASQMNKEILAVAADYFALSKKFKDAVDESKDKQSIQNSIATMAVLAKKGSKAVLNAANAMKTAT